MWNRRGLLVLIVAAIIASLGCTCPCISMLPLPGGDPMCQEAPYSPPPETLQESDLVGTWEAYYWGDSVDTLIMRDDGTFKQIFYDPAEDGYRYETPWNRWWLEKLPDGAVRLHLAGARYYPDGIETAEGEGVQSYGEPNPSPMPFFDPFAEEGVFMVGELVLQVRADSAGELLLHHLWMHHDGGFAIAGCQREQFRRVETP
jgi:hypothetical protein